MNWAGDWAEAHDLAVNAGRPIIVRVFEGGSSTVAVVNPSGVVLLVSPS